MPRQLLKAEYLFRPSQVFKRGAAPADGLIEARLSWGRRIRVSARDNIGPAVLRLGIYDLVVAETLWRLTDASDIVVDAGANMGCMSAVLAERAALVYSFEPHPKLFAELSGNAQSLREQGVGARFELHQSALGEVPGRLPLKVPRDFERHRGVSSLASAVAHEEAIEVEVSTLDRIFSAPATIGVIKIDVEGFERQVLLGATQLLSQKRIRDCVFEEHRRYPTDVTSLLESHGYQVFRLARGLFRPKLLDANSVRPRSTWEATSFLATSKPERAVQRMRRFGWRALGR